MGSAGSDLQGPGGVGSAPGGNLAEATGENHGLGIKSMYHRARLISAGFQLTSTVGAGTTAQIKIPYQSTDQSIPTPNTNDHTL